MTDKTCKVGDVVAWADVPDGAMVLHPGGDSFDAEHPLTGGYAVRYDARGTWVRTTGHERGWRAWEGYWSWSDHAPYITKPVTIVALHLTGQESAADLQRLAEVFEVREAVAKQWGEDLAEELAERLHAAGWRPGMTAEDAARLLAGAGK